MVGISYTKKQFSLIELLVVVGVMGLLMTMAMPQFSSMIKGNKVNNVVSKIGSTLSHCRTYAISKRRQTRFTITDGNSEKKSSATYTSEYLKQGGVASNSSDWMCLESGGTTALEKKLESTVSVTEFAVTFKTTGATVSSVSQIDCEGADEDETTKSLTVNQFTGKVKYL